MTNDVGIKLYNITVNPCGTRNGIKTMRTLLGLGEKENAENIIPETWSCPLAKVCLAFFSS